MAATVASFDGEGFNLNWSNVEASGKLYLYLAIENEACLTTVVNTVVAVE
jgi:hypothetical protein